MKIKALAITDRGIEPVTAEEIKEMTGCKAESRDSCVSFDAELDDILKFTYMTQSSDRVLALLASFSFRDEDDLLKKAEVGVGKLGAENLKLWFSNSSTFRVDCERRGVHEFGSQSVEPGIGDIIGARVKKELSLEPGVDLKNPDATIYLFLNNDQAYIGVDLAGRDLSKRHYRIFTSPGTVNAKIAFAIGRMAGFGPKKRMVDLYSKAGIISIEAALHANNISVNFYNKDFSFKKLPGLKERDWDSFFKKIDSKKKSDELEITAFDSQLRNVEATKKNAKLAGVDKLFKASKMDLDWMDVKLDESGVDLVVSRIACPSNHHAEGMVKKVYKELFHQAEFFLKSGGKLCLLGENLALLRESITKDFKIAEEKRIWGGQMEYEFIILERVEKEALFKE
ncbi:methyltransferase [Candidatus Woesearchaeota archaeon]|nr:methyltransferase [Candidatus Woesearchaeota archaeon]